MTDFVCEVSQGYSAACERLPFYAEHEGKRYCVLHYPGENKAADFEDAKQSKLVQKDYDFSGAVFPEGASDFEGREFDANAIFAGVTFIGKNILCRSPVKWWG